MRMRRLLPIAFTSTMALLACKSNSIVSSTGGGSNCGGSTDCRVGEICAHDQVCRPACTDAGTCPDATNVCTDGACYPAAADSGAPGTDASTCAPMPGAGTGMLSGFTGNWQTKPIPQSDVFVRRGSGMLHSGSLTFYGSELGISLTSFKSACGYAQAGHVHPGARVLDIRLILWSLNSPGPDLVAGTYSTYTDGGTGVWVQVYTVDASASCSEDGGAPKYDGPFDTQGTITLGMLTKDFVSGTIDVTMGGDRINGTFASDDCILPGSPTIAYACCAP